MIPLFGEIDVLFVLDNGDHHIPEISPLSSFTITIVKGAFLLVISSGIPLADLIALLFHRYRIHSFEFAISMVRP